MRFNPHKTVSASSKGIIISFRDANKHMFLSYEKNPVLEDVQLHGHKQYQQLEAPVFNKVQHKLYAQTVYGLSYFPTAEVEQMSKSKKLRIMARYAKTQRILNRWKQQIVHSKVDAFLLALFPHSPITKTLVDTQGYDREAKETHSFKDLGISQQAIADKLIEADLLPKNFYQLA